MRCPRGLMLALVCATTGCPQNTPSVLDGGSGGGGATGGGSGGGSSQLLGAGELCTDATLDQVHVRALPAVVFLPTCAGGASCTTRQVRVVVDPDACAASTLSFSSGDGGVIAAPADQPFHVHQNEATVTLTGGALSGHTQLTVFADVHGAAGSVGNACQTNADCTTPGTQCHASVCAATAAIDVYVGSQLDLPFPAYCGTPGAPASASAASFSGGQSLVLPKGVASLSLPANASAPDDGSYLWSVPAFAASIACAPALTVSGLTALGPAITFGPTTQSFAREVPMSIPIDPSLIPSAARLRHVRVVYSSPAFSSPRVVPVTDQRIEPVATATACSADATCQSVYAASRCNSATQVCEQWRLTFKAPRLGTYQAFVASGAGGSSFTRTLTHRALLGLSTGAAGAASVGLRHHDLFDVVAPLGGPSDWTWMSDFMTGNLFGGFRSISPGTTLHDIQLTATACAQPSDCKVDETCLNASGTVMGTCELLGATRDPYAHAETFNTWWSEGQSTASSAPFFRATYVELLRDLGLAFGNLNGQSFSPGATWLPAGALPTDPSVAGTTGTCGVTLEPVCAIAPAPAPWPSGEAVDSGLPPAVCGELAAQQSAFTNCGGDRCSHPLTLQNFFDRRYNPDGIFPVITFCDGATLPTSVPPYVSSWWANADETPLEVALAVDYNGNGVRDELEPVIAQSHEPFSDFGTDGIADAMESGYVPGVNDDPAGDDYDPQYNPSGTENDLRYETGEPFSDVGLDGVSGTPQQPAAGWQTPGNGYDVGEGDNAFTVATGLQNLWEHDAHSIVRQWVAPAKIPAGALDDAAAARLDVWLDSGLRDPFNAAAAARHLLGAWASRGRLATLLTGFNEAPGLDPLAAAFDPRQVDFAELPGIVLQRYGALDPTAADVQAGRGLDLGTPPELTARLQAALYFTASRWAGHPELRLRVKPSADHPASGAAACEVAGSCTLAFTSSTGRTGPVQVVFPPGYAHADLQMLRYPVVYVLHGYEQTEDDVQVALGQLSTWWNDPLTSGSSRLAKAIVVFADGRCRPNSDGGSECLRGTFYADSPRPGGAQAEQWLVDLTAWVDAHYRTLAPDTATWTE